MPKCFRIKQNTITPSPYNGIYITNSEKHKLMLYVIFTAIFTALSVLLRKSNYKKYNIPYCILYFYNV
ncbi:MAG TPA: hypothetical protein DIC60_08335 [Lachnospiraceae bacterium]|nr:hypothetical protein [Lachnospiraceae bacterium]